MILAMGCGSPRGTDLFDTPANAGVTGTAAGVGGSGGSEVGSGGAPGSAQGGASGGDVGSAGSSAGTGGIGGSDDAGRAADSATTGESDASGGGFGEGGRGTIDAAGPVDRGCAFGGARPGWVCIAPGTFVMGSPASEIGRGNGEAQHRVTITRAFFMMQKEVTQSDWTNVMGKNPSSYPKCGADCPVETVSWYDAVAYADAASAKDGYPPCYQDPRGGVYDAASSAAGRTPMWTSGLACPGYRLPTEAEWEYAARSGTATAFEMGTLTSQTCSPVDANLDIAGWYSCNSNKTTHSGGTKAANAWGLFDMHGNVFEWVWDVYGPYDGDATDPMGPSSGSARVNRGGGWWSPAVDCRAAMRLSNAASKTFDDTGLRLVRSAL